MQRHQTGPPIEVHAPAKLNLTLEVLGRLPDGFHRLRTLIAAVRLSDTLGVEAVAPRRSNEQPAAGGSPAPITIQRVSGPESGGVPTDGRNLVVRVLRELQETAGCRLGARVWLHKRVPNEAGLGGGSSDAAAALVAANRLWRLDWSTDRLSRLAATHGSDIPFFVHVIASRLSGGRPFGAALCTDRGDAVQPVASAAGAPVVIVKPPFGLSTHLVYKSRGAGGYDGARATDAGVDGGDSRRVVAALAAGRWRDAARGVGNALGAAARAIEPRLKGLRQELSRLPVVAHAMTGSGSAHFALCESSAAARSVAASLRAKRLGSVIVTTTC